MTRYNIGAGSFSQPGWINVDLPSEHYSRVQRPGFIAHDLTTLADLPIETGSAEAVYCSHTLEHVPNDAVAKTLSEAYRILAPGGFLRLIVPDIELAHRNWLLGDREFFQPRLICTGHEGPPLDASCTQLFLHHFASQLTEIDADETALKKLADAEVEAIFRELEPAAALDHIAGFARFNHARPENHVNWFDDAKLIRMAREAGFETVYRSGVGQSCFAPMRDVRVFDPHFSISLYVEAIR